MAGTRTYILKWLTGIIAFAMVAVLVGIPISYALHTHAHDETACHEGHAHGHSESQGVPEDACELCAFYAYYVPKEAEAVPFFTFGVPAMPLPIHIDKLRAGQPCTAFVRPDANRGPPASTTFI